MAGKLATVPDRQDRLPSGGVVRSADQGGPGARADGLLDLLVAHLVVALVALVGVGGATRVMQAGLACPDWPLCYGSLLPGRQMNLQVFLEWFHRLDAFLVGLALLVLAAVSLCWRRGAIAWLPWAAGLALVLVLAQGALGALTVLGLLAASSVTAHLVTALLLVALVSGIHQALRPLLAIRADAGSIATAPARPQPPRWWFGPLALASLATLGQCGLGGAMASRWAASLCLEGGEACRWLGLHRLGAWPAAVSLLALALAALALPAGHGPLRRLAWAPLLLVALQVPLGLQILRLQLQEPLLTVAHQLLAALLLALLGALWGRSLVPFAPLTPAPPKQSPLEMAHG
jgi:cytochrome c oxidase assembly protein subunit 15